MELQHHTAKVNGIDLHYVEQGQGPLLLLCHGFPETWYSWRHQFAPLVGAGYRVIAPDMRGYGQSGKPAANEAYGVNDLVGDLVGLVHAVGEQEAVLIAHDWGGMVAWYAALRRPDMFRAAVVMGAPYSPPMALPAGVRLTDAIRAQAGGQANYRVTFAGSPEIDSQLNSDVARSLKDMLYTFSGDVVRDGVRPEGWAGNYPASETFLDQLNQPARLPAWLSEDDLAQYVAEMSESGFTPGLNWYRNLNRLPQILAPFIGKLITQPALYLYGEYDRISGNTEAQLQSLRQHVPGLTDIVCIPGKGHWLQQEAPEEVNRLLLQFLQMYAPAQSKPVQSKQEKPSINS